MTPSKSEAFTRLRWVYFINATLLLCHEIDSAYWREWDLFHIPGGAPGFVAVHGLIIPLLLLGLVQIERQSPASRWTVFLVSGGGALGGLVHAAFLLSGDSHFATEFSMALIAAFGLTSLLLLFLLLRGWGAIAIGDEP